MIPGSGKSPGEGNGNSIQCSFLPGEFHGQRSMVGFSLTPLFSSYLGFPGATRSKEPTCQCRRCTRHGFNLWVGRSPGRGRGNPLQYFCPENPMDREAWCVQSRGVTKSRTERRTHTPNSWGGSWEHMTRLSESQLGNNILLSGGGKGKSCYEWVFRGGL